MVETQTPTMPQCASWSGSDTCWQPLQQCNWPADPSPAVPASQLSLPLSGPLQWSGWLTTLAPFSLGQTYRKGSLIQGPLNFPSLHRQLQVLCLVSLYFTQSGYSLVPNSLASSQLQDSACCPFCPKFPHPPGVPPYLSYLCGSTSQISCIHPTSLPPTNRAEVIPKFHLWW